jgi:hypothetical protein
MAKDLFSTTVTYGRLWFAMAVEERPALMVNVFSTALSPSRPGLARTGGSGHLITREELDWI